MPSANPAESPAPLSHATLPAALASLDAAGLAGYREIIAAGGDCLYAATCATAGHAVRQAQEFRAVWGGRLGVQ